MSIETNPGQSSAEPAARDVVVRLDSVSKEFTMPRRGFRGPRESLRAVDGVSLAIEAGRTVGVVGESGSGKSTLGRMALGLTTPTSGSVSIDGTDLVSVHGEALRRLRRQVQGVYQDPTGALDPRRTVRQSLAEPLLVAGYRGGDLRDRIAELLETVGLDPRRADQRPRQFSGGQRQRIVIARALAASPRIVVADEPVSALDVSVQAQILNLFRDLQDQQDLGCLFVSHDLAVVGFVADSVVVMYRGEVVETGSALEVLETPAHPYTVALRAAARMEKADDPSATAELPASEAVEVGCPYVDRCPLAMARCRIEKPELRDIGAGRAAACFALEAS